MVGRRWLERARPVVERLLVPAGSVLETARAVMVRVEIAVVRRRGPLHARFPAPVRRRPAPRVVAVITHVAHPERDRAATVARLEETIDGLLASLGDAELECVLNTMPGRHVADELPAHQRALLTIAERDGVEPLFLGFEAQREFEARAGEADWFVYLEDDLVLSDGLVLEKLAYFETHAPEEALLLPHRYEVWRGRKVYVDLLSRRTPGERRAVGRLTVIEIGGWKFGEFENPHSGCYFLSRRKLARWLESGRRWYGIASYAGPRESAATGCLEECFRLYKPHPENMAFFEIRHWGTTYAEEKARIHGGG